MNDFLYTLFTMTLGGSLAALVLLVLRRTLCRHVKRSAVYYLWLVVLLRLCLPLRGFVSLETWEDRLAADSAVSAPVVAAESVPTPYPVASAVEESVNTPVAHTLPARESTPQQPQNVVVRRTLSPDDWSQVLFILWCAGTLASLLWFILGYIFFARDIRRSALPPSAAEEQALSALGGRGIRLRRSPLVSTPLLMGFLRPLIVLPAQPLAPEDLLPVLRHELIHARRLDLPYKWFSLFVLSCHWFNPLVYLIRRQMNRDCELSCDEAVIASLSSGEKQRYGELLIRLAAARPLPAGLPATTLSEDKEQLRERLVSIMHHRHGARSTTVLALAAALLLCGCAGAVGTGAQTAETPGFASGDAYFASGDVFFASADAYFASGDAFFASAGNASADPLALYPSAISYASPGNVIVRNSVRVSTVDELLAAIAPYTTVILEPGVYNLDEASPAFYDYCYWRPLGFDDGGRELVIAWADNLCLKSASGNSEDVSILCQTRPADVLTFENCYNVQLCGLTLGHTDGAVCSGGVLAFEEYVGSAYIDRCDLYGCGILGVQLSQGGRALTMVDTVIHDCSQGALLLQNVENLLLQRCEFRRCGPHGALISVNDCGFMRMDDCIITDNTCGIMLNSSSLTRLTVDGCRAQGNNFDAYFSLRCQTEPVIRNSEFPALSH